MKRLLVVLLAWLLSTVPAVAECSGFCVYLPLVVSSCGVEVEPSMSDWKIIIPQSTTNMALNPSGETTGNFAAEAGTTVTRVTTYQHYGLYSYRVETSADNEGVELTLSTLTNAIHYVTVRVRGTLPAAWDWSLNDATFTAPTLLEAIDSNWSLYGLQFPAAQANGSTKLSIHQNGAGSGDFYLDGIQVEAKSTWTTYCDGTQEGCAWNGVAHASTSTRSAYSRAGGQVYDLETDYYLNIGGMSGTGTPPQSLGIDKYATLPGGELNSLKIDSRVFTLTGVITGTSQSDFHARKQALLSALSPDTYPEDENGVQPVRLRYQGAAIHKEISAHYDGGLEGELSASDPCAWEKVAVRFLADDPYWYEYGESAALLDTNDSATFRYVAGRLKSTGQWSNLGLIANPTTNGVINAVEYNPVDKRFYIGGDFTGFNGVAGRDYIAAYDPSTNTWSTVGAGSAVNGIVYSIAIAANGDVYFGGSFTNCADANGDYVAYYDLSANAMASVSGGGTGTVYALTFDNTGKLFIGGSFTDWNAIAAGDRIVSWDNSNYAAVGAGMNGTIYALMYDPSAEYLYAGGNSTNLFNRIGRWDGSAWSALMASIAPDDAVLVIKKAPDGKIHIGGQFNSVGTFGAYLVAFNGASYESVNANIITTVNDLDFDSNGVMYIGTSAPTPIRTLLRLYYQNAYWDSDITIDSATAIEGLAVSPDGIVLLGFTTSDTGNFGGIATVTNDGNVPAQPRFIVYRTGGTTAALETLRNENTGKELLYNYALLPGETLTTDLAPTEQSVISSFFGSRPDAMLANSDFGSWQLLPGSNSVTSFVATSGAPTVTAYLLWKDRFKSQD